MKHFLDLLLPLKQLLPYFFKSLSNFVVLAFLVQLHILQLLI